MIEAVEKHGYSQKEVADHLGMHYSTISKIVGLPRSKTWPRNPIEFYGGDLNLYGYVRNNPMGMRDPMGLWTPEFHENTTRARARTCGMSIPEAETLAQIVRGVDFSFGPFPSFSTLYWHSAKHAMPGTNWSQYVATQLNRANTTGNLKALGRAIHALQDAYAHDIVGAGMRAHVTGNPDDPFAEENRIRAIGAETATTDVIRDFMKARGQKPECSLAE
jgi:helix-turn-helix protein